MSELSGKWLNQGRNITLFDRNDLRMAMKVSYFVKKVSETIQLHSEENEGVGKGRTVSCDWVRREIKKRRSWRE
jgi:hypothetical protein